MRVDRESIVSGGRREQKSGGVVTRGSSSSSGGENSAIDFKPPLRPRKALFVGLLIALALWVGFLIVLYFTTSSTIHRL